jgi:hypothetical protein
MGGAEERCNPETPSCVVWGERQRKGRNGTMQSMRDAAMLLVLLVLAASVRVSDRPEPSEPQLPTAGETLEASWEIDIPRASIPAVELPADSQEHFRVESAGNVLILRSESDPCKESLSHGEHRRVYVLELETVDPKPTILKAVPPRTRPDKA